MTDNCSSDITPYKKSNKLEKPDLVRLDYTCQDFWSLKSRLIDNIKEKFGDQFSDFIESDLAIMLTEQFAFGFDTLSFKIDQIANEIYIDSVTEVDNAFRLSELMGFKPLPPIGGRAFWTGTIISPLDTDLIIEEPPIIDLSVGDSFSSIELFPKDSNDNPMFDEPIVIPAGATSISNIIGVEGRTRVSSFTGTGEANQTFELQLSPVLFDSVRVRVDGVNYVKVDSFTDSNPRREFRLEHDSNFTGYIVFGNSRAGFIPPVGSDIKVTYRTGGGTIGNIVTGSLSVQKQFELVGGALGFSVAVTFFNHTKGEFGYAGDGTEEIRRKLPLYLNTQNRAVSGNDYKNFTDQFATPFHGQIGKSTAILRNHGCAANVIDLYILTKENDDDLIKSNSELKADLQEALEDVKMMTDFVCIKDGVVVEVDVTVDVVMDKFFRKFEDEFKARVERIVNNFFSINRWEYDQNLKDSDLIRELGSIKEVKTFEIDFQTNDPDNSGTIVTTKFFEIIRPDTLDINFTYE